MAKKCGIIRRFFGMCPKRHKIGFADLPDDLPTETVSWSPGRTTTISKVSLTKGKSILKSSGYIVSRNPSYYPNHYSNGIYEWKYNSNDKVWIRVTL